MNCVRIAALAACAAAVAVFSFSAEAQDRRVNIINETGVTLQEFYGSNVDRTDWEEDILGPDILSPGASVVINFDDGSGQCMFDFKAIFADGDELIAEDINVCEISEYRYTAD